MSATTPGLCQRVDNMCPLGGHVSRDHTSPIVPLSLSLSLLSLHPRSLFIYWIHPISPWLSSFPPQIYTQRERDRQTKIEKKIPWARLHVGNMSLLLLLWHWPMPLLLLMLLLPLLLWAAITRRISHLFWADKKKDFPLYILSSPSFLFSLQKRPSLF